MTELDSTSLYVMRRHGTKKGLAHLYGGAPNVVDKAAQYFRDQLKHVEVALLDGRKYLMGDQFTTADILLSTCLSWAIEYDVGICEQHSFGFAEGLADLDKRLTRSEGDEGGRLVVVEGIYSMLGDRAPLADFVEVKKKHGFQLLVDEAHSFGVLGPHGRGLADEAGLEDEVDFVVGTFSKSVGAIGGFGAGNHPLFEYLRYAMRPYMFTASSSPASVATSIAAIRKLAAEPQRRARLAENSARLFHGFKALGLELGCDQVSPVIAVRCPDEPSTIAMWNALLKSGVYVNIALPPGTPNKQCLLRCSVSAAHTDADIDRIIALFDSVVAQGHGKKAANG